MAEYKCSYKESLDIDKCIPHPKNTNKHTEKQIELLAKLIRVHGFRHPIIISNRSGFIVAGHARLEAAKKLGLTQVPVDYQDFENEAMEFAFINADNEVARLAELDQVKMFDEIKELNLPEDFDLELFGIPDLKVDVSEVGLPDLNMSDGKLENMTFTVAEGQAMEIRDALSKCKEKFGDAFDPEVNENSNGNALAYICELFTSGS